MVSTGISRTVFWILNLWEKKEKTKDKEGHLVSYRPPRYKYYYDFFVILRVEHPYFDEMKFQLNGSAVEIETRGSIAPRPENNIEYREYKAMGEEIKEALLNVRQQVRDEVAAAAAPKAAVTCPYCGATTTPDASGCCEYCGGAVNG